MYKKLLHVLLFGFLLIGCAVSEAAESTPVLVEQVVEVATAVPTEPPASPVPPTPTNLPDPTPVPLSYERSADIPYVTDRNPRHTLDIYLPLTGEAPYPTLFMLHPGGFTGGEKEWMLPFAAYFTAQGYAAVVPNYRLLPDAIFPAQLQDSFCALGWTHANADKYGLDPARIVTFGYSSGANLAGMIGAVDDPIPYLEDCAYSLYDDWTQGVIVLAGRTILADYPNDEFTAYLGGTVAELPELWQKAAPVTYLDETDPPCLVAQGGADELLPLEVSEKYIEALARAGIAHTFLPIPDAGHFFPTDIASVHTQVFLEAASGFLATLPARTPLLEKPRVLMTSAAELIGIWKIQVSPGITQRHDVYYKFTEDGRFFREADTTEFSDFSPQGDYWFEDSIFYLELDEELSNLCSGYVVVGSYEVEILSEDEITFHKVSDTCNLAVLGTGNRSAFFQSVWKRVE